MSKKQPEQVLLNEILDYLRYRGALVIRIKNTAVMFNDKKTGKLRFGPARIASDQRGVADIVGLFRRFPFAIEVKVPGRYPTPEQKDWQARWNASGGKAIVARSIEDVEHFLGEMAPVTQAVLTGNLV